MFKDLSWGRSNEYDKIKLTRNNQVVRMIETLLDSYTCKSRKIESITLKKLTRKSEGSDILERERTYP